MVGVLRGLPILFSCDQGLEPFSETEVQSRVKAAVEESGCFVESLMVYAVIIDR
jgi:hypothetical protein